MDGIGGVNNPFLVSNGCDAPLAPGAQCVIGIGFGATAAGTYKATLMILDDAKTHHRQCNFRAESDSGNLTQGTIR